MRSRSLARPGRPRFAALLALLLVAASAPERAFAAISNPSFEDDGEIFNFTSTRFPLGWGGVLGAGGLRGKTATFGMTDGAFAAQLYISVTGASPGSSPVRLTQSLDLTGIDVIAFDAQLLAESGWNPLVVASFRIDGALQWSRTANGFYQDQSIDTSALTGVHEIEFRLSTTDSGPGTGGHNFFIDHLREIAPPPRLTSARVDPLVIRAGLDTFTMTVTASDPAVSEIQIDLTGTATQGGVPAGAVVFRDDGTNGDELEGDGVFTAEGLGLVSATGTTGIRVPGARDVSYLFPAAPTIQTNENLALSFRYMDPSLAIPVVFSLAPDVRTSSHAVSMSRPILGSFPDHNIDRAALAQRYYELFPDDLDFFFISHDYANAGPSGSFALIRNDVVGTGRPLVDNSAQFGSSGVLRGLVNTYYGNAGDFGLLNHELLHYWAAFLDPALDLGASHWGAIVRPSTGFGAGGPNLVYDRLELVAGNDYLGIDYPDATSGAFNDLELYLMGLIADSEVASPIETLVDPVFQSIGAPVCDPICGASYQFSANGIAAVTMAEIIGAQGVRSPAFPISPQSFNGKLVVAYDRVLTDTEFAFFHHAMREYEKAASPEGLTFEAATGERAVLYLPEPGADLGIVAGIVALAMLDRLRRRPDGILRARRVRA
jgi:hypothetical protein